MQNIEVVPVCNSMFHENLTFSCKKSTGDKVIKLENDYNFKSSCKILGFCTNLLVSCLQIHFQFKFDFLIQGDILIVEVSVFFTMALVGMTGRGQHMAIHLLLS